MGWVASRGGRLRRIVDWAVACLRRQRMNAKRPEGPALSGQRPPLPARAMSAQVKLTSPVYPVYSVHRADRGPAPITRLIHLLPPAVCCRVQVPQLHHIDCSHVNLLPGSAARAGTGHHRPAQSGSAAPVAIIAPGRRSAPTADSAGSRAGRTTRVPSACPPPLIQSGHRPARYRPGPDARPRDQGPLETLPSGPCRQD
jgi:hypothetical protein